MVLEWLLHGRYLSHKCFCIDRHWPWNDPWFIRIQVDEKVLRNSCKCQSNLFRQSRWLDLAPFRGLHWVPLKYISIHFPSLFHLKLESCYRARMRIVIYAFQTMICKHFHKVNKWNRCWDWWVSIRVRCLLGNSELRFGKVWCTIEGNIDTWH